MRAVAKVAALCGFVVACWLVGAPGSLAQTGGIEPTDADLRQAIRLDRADVAAALQRKCLPNPYLPYRYRTVWLIPADRLKAIERTWGFRRYMAIRVHSRCNDPRLLAHRWAESWAGRCVYGAESGGNIRSRSYPSGTYRGKWQMNAAFELAYGRWFVSRWDRADSWPEWAQDVAAWRGYKARGWSPWPNTARACGLL